MAVGDLDNDGDLDLFQAAGGLGKADRSLLLLNLGGGHFIDITEAAGVAVVGNAEDTGFGDLDNDGDLDLTLGTPRRIWRNDGRGTFTEAAAEVVGEAPIPVVFWDYDLDGQLDGQGYVARFRNRGNDNHWLRVELAGVASNRTGIGARLIARSGDLRQMREILGGRGFNQDEPVAHFGLGKRTRVDTLIVRWPSGQVDVLVELPADQRIRVIEGRGEYFPVQPSLWEVEPVDSQAAGAAARITARVRPALFEPEARVTDVTADLSALGGPADVPLVETGDGAYELDTTVPAIAARGRWPISILVDQATSLGPWWVEFTRLIVAVAAEDLVIFADGPAPGVALSGQFQVELDPASSAVVYRGSSSLAVRTKGGFWRAKLQPPEPLDLSGFGSLRFALHPGDVDEGTLEVQVSTARVALWSDDGEANRVDLALKEWQVVEIPLSEFNVDKATRVELRGQSTGTLYLDDLRLVAPIPSPPVTAVAESRDQAAPEAFALDPSYPNPFNAATTIGFDLPAAAQVELTLHDLAGQRVATLARGFRAAGHHTLSWGGRDDAGRPMASGVYLFRLEAGGRVQTRKLLLLR